MPNFKIVYSSYDIPLNNNWKCPSKFNQKDKLVDAKGNAVSSDYKENQYRIIDKRERTFSIFERIGRVLLGILAVVCTFSLLLISKSVRNLFIKTKENAYFGVLEKVGELQQTINAALQTVDPALFATLQQHELLKKKKLEIQIKATEERAAKKTELLEQYAKTVKEKEIEYQKYLADLQSYAYGSDTIKAKCIESLNRGYDIEVGSRKQVLDLTLQCIESTYQNALKLADVLSPLD